MNYRLIFIFFFIINSIAAAPLDSVGVKTMNGRKFIVHKVERKETWYAISRRYSVNVDSLQSANKGLKLNTGIQILIPSLFQDSVITSAGDAAHANADAIQNSLILKHKVSKGETLAKIAQQYGITATDIIKWNGLKESKAEIGQLLIVNAGAARLPYKSWSMNQDFNDSSKYFSSLKSTELITETGGAIIKSECKSICMKNVVAGGFVMIANPALNTSTVEEVTVNSALFDKIQGEVIVVISPTVAAKLNLAQDLFTRIQLIYPASK